MAVYEAERTAVDAARNETKQGRQRLEAKSQSLHSTCAGEFSSSCFICFTLVTMLGCYLVVSSGLCLRVLLDQEEKVVVD